MNYQLLILFLVIHFLISIIYLVFILTGRSNLPKEFIAIIFLIPLFGFLAGLAVEIIYLFEKQGESSIEQMIPQDEDDILWKPLKKYEESKDIVPLEESLLISNTEIRRKMMLDVLYHDPQKYMEVLMLARFNEDVETAHYATTTIAHIQKNYQLELQKAGTASEEDPTDLSKLDKYITVVEKYIDSGLLEEHLLRNQRLIYSNLLDRKLSMHPNDKETLIKKQKNLIELQEYTPAYEIVDTLIRNWPEDEEVWIEAIRVCVEARDQDKLNVIVGLIKASDIQWTQDRVDMVKIWIDGE